MWIAKAMARTDLSPLTGPDIMALEAACTPRRVPAGTVLFAASTAPAAVHIVREGRVHLAMRNPTIGRQTIGIIEPGGVIGDIALLTQEEMAFDAYADLDSTLLSLERDQFLKLLSDSPSLGVRWATSLAQRLAQSQSRLVTLLTKDLAAQIATVLIEHRVRLDGLWVVQMPHQTIAHLLGARRQSVSRVLGQLRRDGLVRSRYGSVEILDLPGVAALAGRDADGDMAASA